MQARGERRFPAPCRALFLCVFKNGGKLGNLQVLTAGADPMPIYAACGLSVVALAIALFSSTIAYYAMWALAIVVFALAVYYTVKQL